MTVQEALQNIVNVVSNAKMTGPEHDALRQSIGLVAQRCKLAGESEDAAKADQESQKEANQNEEGNQKGEETR